MKCPTSCPLCYANVKGRSNYKGHRHYMSPSRKKEKESWKMYVKRVVAAAGGGSGVAAVDPKFSEKYPATWEYLSQSVHEDGAPRKLAKLSLSLVEGRWTAC